MGFVVVSLSLGNSVFPLAHGGGGHVEAAGHLLLGEAQGFALLLNDGVHGHERDPLLGFLYSYYTNCERNTQWTCG